MNTFAKPDPSRGRPGFARRFRLLVAAGVAVLAAGGAAAATALSSATSPAGAQDAAASAARVPGTVQAPAGSTAGITVTYPASVPAGYSTPSGIAADAHGGVWYFAESAHRDTLFHVNATTGKTSRYQLPPSVAIRSGAITPVVTDAGQVWIGINSTLVGVNASSGVVRVVRLPVLPLVSRKVAILPVPPPGRAETTFEDVQSMTVGAHGTIVIGRLFATDLQTYDPHSGATGTVALPAGSVLAGWGSDLAALPSGSVDAVLWRRPGTAPGSIVLESHGPAGWSAVGTGGCAVRAVAQGAGQVLTLGGGCASRAAAQSSAVTLHALALTAGGSAPPVLSGAGVPLSATADIVGTASGAELLRDGQATAVPLGTTVLAPPIGGLPRPRGKTVPDRVAPMLLGLVSAQSAGHVWFTSGYGGPQLGLLTVGS